MTRPKMTKAEAGERLHDRFEKYCNDGRDHADEVAAKYDCDDPMHPFMPTGDIQPFRDWVDFVERVCVPLVEQEGDEEAVQTAMKLYRQASPYFICVSLYMAWKRSELRWEDLPGDGADYPGADEP